jgi:hypothetical protein
MQVNRFLEENTKPDMQVNRFLEQNTATGYASKSVLRAKHWNWIRRHYTCRTHKIVCNDLPLLSVHVTLQPPVQSARITKTSQMKPCFILSFLTCTTRRVT